MSVSEARECPRLGDPTSVFAGAHIPNPDTSTSVSTIDIGFNSGQSVTDMTQVGIDLVSQFSDGDVRSSMSEGESDDVMVYPHQPMETLTSLTMSTEEIAEKHNNIQLELDALPRNITGLNGVGVGEFHQHQNLDFSQESSKLDSNGSDTSEELVELPIKSDSDKKQSSSSLNSIKCNVNLDSDSFSGPGLVNMDCKNDMILWQGGIGYLPGSEFKFRVNKFGLTEIVDDEAWQQLYNQSEANIQVIDSSVNGEGPSGFENGDREIADHRKQTAHTQDIESRNTAQILKTEVTTLQSVRRDATNDSKSKKNERHFENISAGCDQKMSDRVLEIESSNLEKTNNFWKSYSSRSKDAYLSNETHIETNVAPELKNIALNLKAEDDKPSPATTSSVLPTRKVTTSALEREHFSKKKAYSARIDEIGTQTADELRAPLSKFELVEVCSKSEKRVINLNFGSTGVCLSNENTSAKQVLSDSFERHSLNGVDAIKPGQSFSACQTSSKDNNREKMEPQKSKKIEDFQNFNFKLKIEGRGTTNETTENPFMRDIINKPKVENFEPESKIPEVPKISVVLKSGGDSKVCSDISDSQACSNSVLKQTFTTNVGPYMRCETMESDEAESSSGLPEEELPDIEPLPPVGLQRNYARSRSRSLSPMFHLQPPPPLESKPYSEMTDNPDGFPILKAETEYCQDQDKDIVFCKCCGCFGLTHEFYESVYCTKACGDSYKYHLTSPDGKFKKPSPTTPKKSKLSIGGDRVYSKAGENNAYSRSLAYDQGFSNDMPRSNKLLKKKSKSSPLKKIKNKQNVTKLQLKPSEGKLEGVSGVSSKKSRRVGGTKSTAFHSKDRKRNFPLVLSKRMPVSPERKCVDNLFKDVQLSPDITLGKTKQTPPKMTPSSSLDFDWQKYLIETKSKGAPHRLFRQPAMPPPNPFKESMYLESIDPQHQSLICVVSVVETQGYRVRLRFDGFSEAYDYWVNADSLDIFPPGWCEENGLELQPPPGAPEPFNWHQYIVEKEIQVAPRHIFAVTKEDFTIDSGVKPGMKMEAVDIRNQNLVCVATVAKVMGERILVHFDSWDSLYDYWTDLTSPYIHPVGWCDKNNVKLTPPNYCKSDFVWENYLKDTGTIAMPFRLFRPLPPVGFKKGFKIECVDKRNPFLIRVATISEVDQHNLVIHFDNWASMYDFKVYELSPDIHPVGWCAHTGHPLQPPHPSDGSWKNSQCVVTGCLGLGHIRGPKFLTHNSEKNCPYALHNYKKDWILADRITILERNYGQGHNDNSSSVESAPKTVESKVQIVPAPTSSKKEGKPMMNASKLSALPKSATIKRKRSSASSSKDAQHKRPKVVPVTIAPRTPSPTLPVLMPISVLEPAKFTFAKNVVTIPNRVMCSEPEQIDVRRTDNNSYSYPPKVQSIPGPSSASRSGQPHCAISSSISPAYGGQNAIKIIGNVSELKQPRFSLPSTSLASFPIGASVENEGIQSPNFDSHVVPLKTVVGSLHEATVSSWKVEELARFISTIQGCEHTANKFLDQLIDGESFMMLSQNDFINVMGLKLGPAIKLSNVIRMISDNSGYKSN